jgi:hypothetical protein
VNAPVFDLAAEGSPTIGAPPLREPQDLDGPALMQALGEDGVTLTERSVGTPRDGLRLEPMREAQSPENDDDAETLPTRRTVSTGDPEGTRQDCPNCPYDGRMANGTECPRCRGTGLLVKRSDGTVAAASAVQRLAESALASASDLTGVPLRSDGDLDICDVPGAALDLGACRWEPDLARTNAHLLVLLPVVTGRGESVGYSYVERGDPDGWLRCRDIDAPALIWTVVCQVASTGCPRRGGHPCRSRGRRAWWVRDARSG